MPVPAMAPAVRHEFLLHPGPLLPLLGSQLGAKSQLGLEALIDQLVYLRLQLASRGLDGGRIGLRVGQEIAHLLPGRSQGLEVRLGRSALVLKQRLDLGRLLIVEPQLFLDAVEEHLSVGGAIPRAGMPFLVGGLTGPGRLLGQGGARAAHRQADQERSSQHPTPMPESLACCHTVLLL